MSQASEKNENRFDLLLLEFPSQESLEEACLIIYRKHDKNLLAAMASTPYTVGRSFDSEDQERIHSELKKIGVSHQFDSKLTGEKISFDSKKSGQATTENLKSVTTQRSVASSFSIKKPFLAIAGGLIAVFVISGIFFFSSDSSDQKPKANSLAEPEMAVAQENTPNKAPDYIAPTSSFDARVEKTTGSVDSRKKDTFEWTSAKSGDLLQAQDSIRTAGSSYAALRYREGSRIQIKENTLLVIGESLEKSKDDFERELSLSDGSIHARLVSKNSNQKLKIKTPQGQIVLKQDKGTTKPSHLSTSFQDGQLQVQVAEGSAKFLPLGSEDSEIEIPSNTQILATKTSVSNPVEYKPSIQLLSPGSGDGVTVEDGKEDQFLFKWEPVDSEAIYTWTLASDSQMENTLFTKETAETEMKLSYIVPGQVFWQVSATIDDVLYTSPIYTLHVVQN